MSKNDNTFEKITYNIKKPEATNKCKIKISYLNLQVIKTHFQLKSSKKKIHQLPSVGYNLATDNEY